MSDNATKLLYTSIVEETRTNCTGTEQYLEGLKKLVPKLPVRASKEMCIWAFSTWSELLPNYLERHKKLMRYWKEELDEFSNVLFGTDSTSPLSALVDGKLEQAEMEQVISHVNRVLEMLEYSIQIQIHMHEMMKDQSEELTLWFLAKFDTPHVSEETKCPSGEDFCPDSGFLDLPVDVATTIFSFLDLETCVLMRGVSRFWYSLFQDSNAVLAPKVKEKNPWMEPTGEMSSWSLCALVLAKRLEKWSPTCLKDHVSIPTENLRKVTTSHTVVARELKEGEKLPSSTRGMRGDSGGMKGESDEVILENDFRFNPWTHEVHFRWDREKFKHLSDDEHSTTARFRDFEVTLPPGIRLGGVDQFASGEVWIGNEMLLLRPFEYEYQYLVSRDEPHYENGMRFNTNEVSHHQAGDVFYQDTANCEHFFYHPATKKRYAFQANERWLPIAFYNGLIWWLFLEPLFQGGSARNLYLVPTFIDVQHEEKIHIMTDRITVVPADYQYMLSDQRHGSRVLGADRFLIFDSLDGGMNLLDLATMFFTQVRLPGPFSSFETKAKCIPSIDNGILNVRYVSYPTIKTYFERALREVGRREPEVEEEWPGIWEGEWDHEGDGFNEW